MKIVVEGRWVNVSSAGMKRVAESGSVEGFAPDRMFDQVLKSPAPIRASIMLFTCCSCVGGDDTGADGSGEPKKGVGMEMVSMVRRSSRDWRWLVMTEGERQVSSLLSFFLSLSITFLLSLFLGSGCVCYSL